MSEPISAAGGHPLGLLAAAYDGVLWVLDARTLRLVSVDGRALGSGSLGAPADVDALLRPVAAPAEREKLRAAATAVAGDGVARRVMHSGPSPGGEPRWYATDIHRVDAGGGPLLVGVGADVSRFVSAERREGATAPLLDAVVQAAPVAICAFDRDGQTPLAWNPAAERLFGWTAAEVLTAPRFMDAFVPDGAEKARFEELLERLRRGESVSDVGCVRRRKDGREVAVSVAAAPLAGRAAADARHVEVLVDLSRRARLEQERERARSLIQATLESTADGILVVDRARRVVNFNAKIARFWNLETGLAPDNDDRARVEQASAAAREPRAFVDRIEEIYAHPEMEALDTVEMADGRVLERFTQPQRLRGEVVGRVWSLRDVTERKRAERALAGAKRRYEALVDALDGIVWQADGARFTLSFVSAGAERLLGYPASRWLEPEFWTSHLHPADRERVVEACRSAIREGRSHDIEYRMLAADGRTVWLRDLIAVAQPPSGPPTVRGVIVDITAQKRAEAERDRLLVRERETRMSAEAAERRSAFLARAGEILASSLDYEPMLQEVAQLVLPRLADWCAVDLLDGEGRLRRVAVTHVEPERAEVARRLATSQVLEPRWPYAIAPGLRGGQPQLVREVTPAMLDRLAVDEESRRALEELGCRSLVGAPLRARGRLLGFIVLVYGPSRRRYEVRDLNLLQELAGRAAIAVENASLYADARDAVRARDEFLSVASHELRTPCTSLQLGIQSLLRLAEHGGLNRAPPALVKTVLETAQRQSRRLAQLIDKLLDISRLRAGRLELDLEAVDVAAITREVVAGFREDLGRCGSALRLAADDPVVGRWDGARVGQVVTNLVSNAVKYGAGKPIDIAVTREGPFARITVRDRGIGIAPEKQARVFERFERAVSARNYGGLGLGLYITRQIVLALGGDVALESRPGEGSRFSVTLPLAGPAAQVGPASYAQSEAQAPA